jgi:hypothetical protein
MNGNREFFKYSQRSIDLFSEPICIRISKDHWEFSHIDDIRSGVSVLQIYDNQLLNDYYGDAISKLIKKNLNVLRYSF